MKICLINDTHAGARGDSLLFNEFFFKFWEGTFFPYLKENNIKQIIHLGDVVDRRKYINYIILNQWRKRFFDVLERENIQMDIIVGNHDVTYKNTNEINAMHELFNKYDNINVYIEPVEKIYDENDLIKPYQIYQIFFCSIHCGKCYLGPFQILKFQNDQILIQI